MKKEFGLTGTEMELMELLWTTETPLTFKEIMYRCHQELKKEWRKQTLNTYLSHLIKAGLVNVNTDATFFTYMPRCTKAEHISNWTQELVRDMFDNSICNFVAAFTGNKKLSEEEISELRKLL